MKHIQDAAPRRGRLSKTSTLVSSVVSHQYRCRLKPRQSPYMHSTYETYVPKQIKSMPSDPGTTSYKGLTVWKQRYSKTGFCAKIFAYHMSLKRRWLRVTNDTTVCFDTRKSYCEMKVTKESKRWPNCSLLLCVLVKRSYFSKAMELNLWKKLHHPLQTPPAAAPLAVLIVSKEIDTDIQWRSAETVLNTLALQWEELTHLKRHVWKGVEMEKGFELLKRWRWLSWHHKFNGHR